MIYVMKPESKTAVIAICYALGIAAAAYAHPIVWAFAVALAVFGVTAIAKCVQRSTVLLAAAAFIVGAVYYSVGREIPGSDISRFVFRASGFDGVVASDPENNEDRTRLICRVNRVNVYGKWHDVSGRVMVNLYDPALKFEYGDHIRIKAAPYPPRDPTNPGGFSWRQYLARQCIYSCAYVKSSSQVHVIKGRHGNVFVSAALKAKHHIEASIAMIMPKREASVMTGMVLGTYSYLPRDTLINFGRTGTLHLLAASGYNCFILLFLTTPILKRIGIMPKLRNEVIIILVIMYLLMVGPKPSLIRASLMATLLLIAPLLKRTPNARTLFFITGLAVLAMNPSNLFDIGFQLSFLAVWALIFISPVVESILQRAGVISEKRARPEKSRFRWLRAISGEIAGAGIATVSVTLFTAPVIAYYFNYFSLVSLPANMALALGVPMVFAGGLLSIVAAPVPILGSIIGWFGYAVTHAMLGIVDYLGSWRHSAVPVSSPGFLAIVGYYLLLYAVLSYVRSRIAE